MTHITMANADEAQLYRAAVSSVRAPLPADAELLQRSKRVLPSLTHLDVSTHIAPGYSQFFSSGAGAKVTSVDGREWIDYMCSCQCSLESLTAL
jgi:4-aminobutyrate aminotransferase-like enzyme